ncbi:MAG: S8 family serine peptidase, partial [Promethearchaeota archaeon]
KIVGWVDFTPGGDNGTAYDDDGHGSHCAGIAAGEGTSVSDGIGRIVASANAKYDLSPYAFHDGDIIGFKSATFNITSPGQIEVECTYKDLPSGPDRAWGAAYLVYKDTVINWTGYTNVNWLDNITYDISSNELGIYELWLIIEFVDYSGDSLVIWPEFAFRGEIHWYFNPGTFGCGNRFKGVAPDTHLVGVKVLSPGIGGSWDDIIMGVEWVIANRKIYNITVMSMSLGPNVPGYSLLAMIDAVDNAVENGIVTVVSAGNDGAGGDYIGSPADADNVITVAAMNHHDQITYYSSQGGPSNSTKTKKPDIMAPGGSANSLMILSADTNDNDCEGEFPDAYQNDLLPAQGTSMACPAVAGAANLLIQAMGGGNNWNWDDGTKSKLVKAILLMTATETYPLQREDDPSFSPQLNRGGKDVHEGYGRINIDAAIEAWLNESIPSGTTFTINPTLNSSRYNPFARHAYARHVYLTQGQKYTFNLSVPPGVDYDLYLYNSTPTEYGEPDLIASSTSAILGKDEIFNFTANHDGKYFLVAKAIGLPYPSGGDGDDNNKKKVQVLDITLFVIIGAIVALIAIIIVIISYKRSKKDYSYEYRPEY